MISIDQISPGDTADMKTVSVHPAVMMKIVCPECGHEHQHMQKAPPTEDFPFKCAGCNADFMVRLDIRVFYRKEVSIPCYYTTALDVENIMDRRVKNGWITDISRTGCAVEFGKLKFHALDERKGNILLIFFSFPSQKELFSIQGQITAVFETSAHKMKMGVHFINLNERQVQRLSLFLMP